MTRVVSGLAALALWLSVTSAAGAEGGAHPRRVWIDFVSGARHVGVAVDTDAAWVSEAPAEAEQVCVEAGRCARVVATLSSRHTLAPLPGKVFVLQRRLVGVTPWPKDEDDEAALIEELRSDIRLKPLLTRYRPPVAPRTSFGLPRIASGRAPTEPEYRWEGSLSAASLRRRHGEAAVFGVEAGFGIAVGSDFERPSEPMFGDSWGVSARIAFYSQRAVPHATDDEGLLTLSVSPDIANIVDPFTLSRFRVPSLLGIVTPEIGWMRQSQWDSAFVRWQLPMSVLLTYSWGLELKPSAGIVYESPTGQADWFFGASIGSFLRIDGPQRRRR